MTNLNRREALLRVSALLGGLSLAGGPRLLAAFAPDGEPGAGGSLAPGAAVGQLTAAQIALLDEIAETILPATHTPGAKAAKTGHFMALMVTDCYSPAEQRVFMDGLRQVDEESRKACGVPFMSATPAQRLTVLESLDREQKRFMDEREAEDHRRHGLVAHPVRPAHFPEQRKEASPEQQGRDVVADSHRPAHYFRMMKELTLLGYFTSEIGCTQAQRYVDTPGRFDACLPYRPGETSWASHA